MVHERSEPQAKGSAVITEPRSHTPVDRLADILRQIEYPGFQFNLKYRGLVPYLQIACSAKCNVTGEAMSWQSRKWMLSRHMTDGEIVQTALKAVLTALEHEAREQFKYLGVAVFDPHFDIEKLVQLRAMTDSIRERAHHSDDRTGGLDAAASREPNGAV